MKTLVLQVNINKGGPRIITQTEDPTQRCARMFDYLEDMYTESNTSVKEWSQRMNADYYCISDDMLLPGYHPAFQKFTLFNSYFDEYDTIIWCDSDYLVHEMTPDISQWINKQPESFFVTNEPKYFNTGFFVIKRDLIDQFKPVYMEYIEKHLNSSHKDQNALNDMIRGNQINYCHLSRDWNGIMAIARPLFGIHYCGIRKEDFTIEKNRTHMNNKIKRMREIQDLESLYREQEPLIIQSLF